MPKYALTYYTGPKFQNQQQDDAGQAKFREWLGGLGDAVVNPGTPLGAPKTVSSDGVTEGDGSERRSTGFSIVTAEDIDTAVEMAKDCPFLEYGTVEVAQVFEM